MQVPLSAFTHYVSDNTPLAINHSGQFPSITISFNLLPGVSLGDAVVDIQNAERDIGLPAAIHGNFSGTAQAFQDATGNMVLLIAAALVTVYIVLGVLYESLMHPVTILSTLPSAGVGALLALLMMQYRSDRDRGYRDHPADRHREEECDHDDRLRARGRAQRGKSPEQAILQACIAALSPHHDDHHGGLARRASAGDRWWHRQRTPQAAGYRHRGRFDFQPDADALHDAGDLPLP